MKRHQFSREWWIYLSLITILLLILGKLFWLQIIKASELKVKGVSFRTLEEKSIPERGMILDAQENILAKSIVAKEIYADPKTIRKFLASNNKGWTKESVAQKISAILEKDFTEILNLLEKDVYWVCLAREVDVDKAEKIAALNIPGIGFNDTYKRVYPMENFASSVLGIVNMSGQGAEGIEYYYDSILSANNELANFNYPLQKDKTSGIPDKNTVSGQNIKLTLDSTIQHVIEQELDSIIEESQPERACILAMDPMSGKILGMASRPTFNPNNYLKTNPEQRKNLAISMIYEPGSTFKIITAAAALEENIISPEDMFNDPGYLMVGSRRITNWDSDRKPHGIISFSDGMRLSSNVVLAQVGKKLGKEIFYTYLKSFGFGRKTKIDIAGEEQGLLIDKEKVKDIELATMSFGQANLVTPIQLLSAVCAVANGGNLYQPYLLDSIISKDGTVLFQNEPKIQRKVLSKVTCDMMVKILEDVVENGTGSRAKIPGIKVAGKTGTAQKIDPNTGTYSETDFIASFVAFAPADNPKIAVLVVIDTPKGDVIQGGTLAAPHAKKIIERALQYYGTPVSSKTPSKIKNFTAFPKDQQESDSREVTPERYPGKGEVIVPNLKGLTIRQAGEILGRLELHYNFVGSGLAEKQFPEPGKIVNKGDSVEVIFSKKK